LEIEVLDKKQMEEKKMGALLGVAQGSSKEPKLVVIKWNGAAKEQKPIAFVGKGITFDTGGVSLKPSRGMESMKYDMAGSAAVVGVMHALAGRKAKVNAIGVVALAENAVGSNAQRPSDVVTSMSGQTIEVLNTDAEGRLILADALWYTQDRFSPKFMIDLATLTGAIVVALGN
ncbi:MAG: leucyl aminopeptidase, partial [Wolbachia sp.]